MAQNGNSNTRRKNHRNQTLEISSSPRTSNSGIISNFINQPDAVNVVDFLASKTEEIKRMEQLLFQNQPVARGRPSNLPTIDRLVTLRDRLHSGKRQFQMLPKHLRRRAASHNIYRLPRKLRGNAIKEIVKSGSASIEQFQEQRKKMKKKRNFKRRRRPQYIVRNYLKRQKVYKWLETHIWSKKRMHFDQLWGHQLVRLLFLILNLIIIL